MNWRQNTDIMHLSCNLARRTVCGTYSTYVLLKADSACENVHKLVHHVVPQKRYVVQGTYLFEWFVIFKTVCPSSIFFFWSVWPSSVVQRTRSMWNSFMHLRTRENLRSCARSYLAIACTIVRTIFLVGPGFEPLALHAIFFVGPGFDSLALQHDLFVGPGFDSRTRSSVFGPVVSVAYVTRPHD